MHLPHLVRMHLLWMRILMKMLAAPQPMLRYLMMTTSLCLVLVLNQVRPACPYCLLSSGLAFGFAGCLYTYFCKLIGSVMFFLIQAQVCPRLSSVVTMLWCTRLQLLQAMNQVARMRSLSQGRNEPLQRGLKSMCGRANSIPPHYWKHRRLLVQRTDMAGQINNLILTQQGIKMTRSICNASVQVVPARCV